MEFAFVENRLVGDLVDQQRVVSKRQSAFTPCGGAELERKGTAVYRRAPRELNPQSCFMKSYGWAVCKRCTLLKCQNNRVARKMRTYFEMGTDGERFVSLKSGNSILRRYI